MTPRTRVRVTGVLCLAHRGTPDGPLHGHTYQVAAWFMDGDALDRLGELRTALADLDHTTLPDHESRAEVFGARILRQLGAIGLELDRPLEGIRVTLGHCG